jgi:hypothetical protein
MQVVTLSFWLIAAAWLHQEAKQATPMQINLISRRSSSGLKRPEDLQMDLDQLGSSHSSSSKGLGLRRLRHLTIININTGILVLAAARHKAGLTINSSRREA